MSEDAVLVEVRNQIGHLTLNRPAGLNALSLDMIRTIARQLDHWEHDAGIRAVVLGANGEKAFCAGGDIRALYDSYKNDGDIHPIYFDEEFALDLRLHEYGKPVLALMDGYVLGGGMGLAQGASIRIISERVRMAMPETAIGYFPDVGASHFLARLPHNVGFYMGLTGNQISAADALAIGLADWYLPHEHFASFIASLDACTWSDTQQDIDRLLAAQGQRSMPGAELTSLYPAIEQHFAADSVDALRTSLAAEQSQEYREWAQATLKTIESRSPLAVNVALEELKRGRTLNLRQCFALELHLVKQWFEAGDLVEGVRALIVDKDKRPQWRPAHFGEVDQTKVAQLFDGFAAAENP
jgi:enoyl-CoA hydratase/carnithine racemase